MKIEVKDYTYKSDENQQTMTGFLAQQLYEVYPNVVTIGGDDPKTQPWSVDYGQLTPLLVKAVQEQQAEIEMWKEMFKVQSSKVQVLESELREIKALLQLQSANLQIKKSPNQ